MLDMRYSLGFLFALTWCVCGCAREPMSNDSFTNPDVAPLAAAVAQGDAAEIKRQLETVHPDTPGADNATLLVEAIRNENLVSVQALLEGSADPNRPGGGGETPMHAAAFVDDPAFLEAVLAHGGNPNVQNPVSGELPLRLAILGHNLTQMKMLLDSGADPNLADSEQDVPLHTAARTDFGQAILLLLNKGASPLAKNSSGAGFQTYYFSIPREGLNARALSERRQIVDWLKAHNVPLEAAVDARY